MSNPRTTQLAKAAWRPMDVLQNTSSPNAIFLQDDYSKPTTSRFKEWIPEKVEVLVSTVSKATSIADDLKEGVLLEGKQPISSIDKERFEKDKAEAYEKGLMDGIVKGKAESQEISAKLKAAEEITESETIKQLLQDISEATWALRENPASLFEPLKRLSIHIAEQLLLTELTISHSSIQALIERCIETLDIANLTQVCVELNPSDLALLQPKLASSDEMKSWRLQADPKLLPGSVRVSADDALVTELVENRLECLAQSLLTDSNHWNAQTAFQPERISARRSRANAIEDVLPHDCNSNEAPSFEKSDVNLDDVLDAATTELHAKHTNISDLNLPNLELEAKVGNFSTVQLDTNDE